MAEPNVVPVIWVAALAYRHNLVDDGRPRIKVGQVFVNERAADCAAVFFGEHLGAEPASAVPVGVARVARCGLVHWATIRPLIMVIVGGQSAVLLSYLLGCRSDTCLACT
jgi:hypothetical protein